MSGHPSHSVDDWRTHALCAQTDPELFYPQDAFASIAARETCLGCPVRVPCLNDGLDEQHGIWGGWTADERKALRRRLRSANKAAHTLIIERAAIHGPSFYHITEMENR